MNNLSISDRPFLISSHLSDQSHHAPRLRRECKPGLSANGHSIQDLFEAQVARTPDAIAISFQDQSLTYGELNARANKLAHRLRALGVGADCLVGICVERSIEMVVGLLGILKAGGAYVPLDPQYPTERLSFMISDTNLSVLLTQQHLRERLPDHHAQLICLDNPAECGDEFSEQNPPQTTSADHLAYVIYTSGSTGRPKGVCIDHRAVVRLVRNTNYLEFAKTDVFLQFAPVSFDASTLELWAPLLNGGRLAICPPGQLSLSELGQVVRQHGVTTLWLSAGLFHQMVDENIEDLDGLKYLLAGGDVLSPKHVKKALERLPLKQLINGYGPTENTTFTCCYGMESVSAVGESTVPIGRPISRTQVYVLNEQLEAVEVGEEGELYTGGAGLARCYLNRPELTAEKFVPNPFSRELGERLYRTGDLVRYLPTGEIEFLGRIDSQVKLRGYRIELGEIEAALNDHEAVRETAVIVREDVAGDKRLVAYVVAQQPAPARRELRTFLKAKLPDYMIPAAFMLLGELPLTANGKVDRRALPAPDQQRPELSTGFVAPRDAVEEVVATIIGQVLGVSRVGREDNFFELGGHSLLATQVITRLRIAFQVELPLRQLFEDSTVASLAVSIKRATRAGGELQAPPLGAVRRDAKLPLSFAQQRLWFIDQLNPGKSHYNLTFPIQLRGELDQRALADSLGEIIHRHESLRTVFPSVDGQPTQKILPAPERMELPSIDLRRESDCKRHQQAEILIQSEARYAFDLANGPLVRTLLVRVAEQEHLLVLTMHHIVTDGWSMGVVMEELAVLYENFSQVNSRERLSPLPELPLQYADFAVWQREWLQGAALEAQLSYWKEQLQGAPALLDFPTDHPRPPVQTFAGARRKLSLGPRTTAALTGVAHKHDATLFMTLLAAFAVLLSRYGRQSDLVVGAPIANRTQPEIEGLVGFFVNTLALRVDLSGNPSFAELLGRVRETALGAYDHQDVPFEKLVEVLQPERALSHTPLFQAMFVLQETVEPKRVQQLEIELLPAPEGVAMFDLVLEAKAIGEGIELSIEYNSDLFEGETAERMLRNFESLVEAIVEDCGQRLSELPVMSGAEREQVLVKWNQTACPFEVEKTVAELFEEQARFGPERMAVEYDRDQ
ncbi:MAG: amino acid adenylation domain-containing protein, partial [Pyrinomonadaceae bacterium]|nr:amino acid adenylation domain-containing protein [Pyrinomonadaceae bacterium]